MEVDHSGHHPWAMHSNLHLQWGHEFSILSTSFDTEDKFDKCAAKKFCDVQTQV